MQKIIFVFLLFLVFASCIKMKNKHQAYSENYIYVHIFIERTLKTEPDSKSATTMKEKYAKPIAVKKLTLVNTVIYLAARGKRSRSPSYPGIIEKARRFEI